MCTYKYLHNYCLKIITSDIYNIYNSLNFLLIKLIKAKKRKKMVLKKTFIMEFFKHARGRKNIAVNPQELII